MFNSPNTAAMMGIVPAHRRGDRRRRAHAAAEHRRGAVDRVRAGDRHLGGAESRRCSRSSRASPRASRREKLAPFIANMHVALWVLAAVSLLGAFVCLLRPHTRRPRARRRRRARTRRSAPGRARTRGGGRHTMSAATPAPASLASPEDAEATQPAHRRRRAPGRHDAADDPLLRGDRAARRRRRAPLGRAPPLHARPRSSACAR